MFLLYEKYHFSILILSKEGCKKGEYDSMAKDEFVVNGYHFGSLEDAKAAEEEVKKADYFRERIAGRKAGGMLAVYDKILDERIFQTPVGWEYLRSMQENLKAENIPDEMIRPIPMYGTFCHQTGEEQRKNTVKQRIRPLPQKKQANKLQISVVINILLAVLIIAMFVITLKSDNPNILNYEKAVVNEYAAWEQELTEREKTVRKKEKELGITEIKKRELKESEAEQGWEKQID